ncbi:hypothetical protein BCR41DRAFT_168459 [Lobosporangium transversale]|uniref:Uncharacterized protein n=1 Tax=Lobosporangium transversale TaxID=64571 RepID=A0A1Y2GBF2_9FUNG|nr:hypothetical protein BCR41DRAFT_168459 [Lobosporangium transversale]ORZ06304.1 hypothetical protein BCR41DRAFT_168459 [Lobosporangium transversale]|eukprot:XP_021877467.1 hypothetical protein BCR41DRAFT_168459 [Lobosporangium transversale]
MRPGMIGGVYLRDDWEVLGRLEAKIASVPAALDEADSDPPTGSSRERAKKLKGRFESNRRCFRNLKKKNTPAVINTARPSTDPKTMGSTEGPDDVSSGLVEVAVGEVPAFEEFETDGRLEDPVGFEDLPDERDGFESREEPSVGSDGESVKLEGSSSSIDVVFSVGLVVTGGEGAGVVFSVGGVVVGGDGGSVVAGEVGCGSGDGDGAGAGSPVVSTAPGTPPS